MIAVILAVVLILVAVLMLLLGPAGGRKKGIATVLIALGVLVFGMNSTTIIEAKNVGVLTTFGKPTGSLDSGLHLKWPWQKVTELDGTKITSKYDGQAAVPVRIGDGTTAHVRTAIRWSIVGEKADEIYANYRSDDVTQTVQESLVDTVFTNALNQVFGQYNPTADLKVVDPTATGTTKVNFVPDYDALAQQVTDSMQERVEATGGYVKIDFITISGIDLSETTQSKINEFQAEVAKTQVALQKKATADAQAEANKVLSGSVSNNPNVLVSRCLDTFQQMVDENQAIPAGFSCWPGSSADLVLSGGTSTKN